MTDLHIFATAVYNLDNNKAVIGWGKNTFTSLDIDSGKELNFTETELLDEINRLEKAEPMKVLREERNYKLAETDWWCCSDHTPTQAQLDYRIALRDLPSTAKPKLDEHGNLTNITWPTKPE